MLDVVVALAILAFVSRLQEELLHPIGLVFETEQPVACADQFAPASKSLSVVIPAYNEEDRLGATLDEAVSYLQRRRDQQGPHFTFEIIVVDDGSSDATSRVGAQYALKHGQDAVRVLRVPRNRGKGHAVKRGMQHTRGELLLFMDADGATRMSDLELLESELAKISRPSGKGPLGAVYGSRSHLQQSAMAKRSLLRNWLTWGFHLCVIMVAGQLIRDTQCGFKLFTRAAGQLIFNNQRLQRWCFDVEIVFLAQQLNLPMAEVPVHWTEMPGSKIRVTSILHMAWELLSIKVGYQVLGTWSVNPGSP